MSAMRRWILTITAATALAGCSPRDDNDAPKYGNMGLPVNCRAYVQVAVDGYRSKRYTADEAMAGIERNCGAFGGIWKNNRER
jgi:hypothetical protein